MAEMGSDFFIKVAQGKISLEPSFPLLSVKEQLARVFSGSLTMGCPLIKSAFQ